MTPREELFENLKRASDEVATWPQWMRDAVSTAHIFDPTRARAATYAEVMDAAARAKAEIAAEWPEWKRALSRKAPAEVAPAAPTILTADEVAAMLGLGRKAVYAGAAAGEIPARRVGRRFVFCREAIAAWLASAPAAPAAPAAARPPRPAGQS